MGRLMRIAPTQAFQRRAVILVDPDQRIIQCHACNIGAGFDRRGLLDIAPSGGAVDIAVDPLDEDRIGMREFARQRPQIVADQPVLQRTQPGGVDQRLGQMLVHLAIPVRQQRQRTLTLAFRCALGRGLAGEPQVRADQRQQRARGEADRIQLRFDETVAGMDLAVLHQAPPAMDPLRIAPKKAHMQRKGTVHGLVVGIPQNAPAGAMNSGLAE